MKTEKFDVTGMTCAACKANIERTVSKLNGVSSADVSLVSNSMTVTYDESKLSGNDVCEAVVSIGYGASAADTFNTGNTGSRRSDGMREKWERRRKAEEDERKNVRRRLFSSIALLVPLMYLSMGSMLGLPQPAVFTGHENASVYAFTLFLITVPVIFINRKFYTNGFRALAKRVPNMDSLVACGSCASLVYGIFSLYRIMYAQGHGIEETVHEYSHQLYFESAAMILTLVTVGKYLEARSKSHTSDALGKLIDLAPKTAVVVRNGERVTVPAEELREGDTVVIRPGDTLPCDGRIIEGSGVLDQSAVTGESIPAEKEVGDTVISASVNKNGSFLMCAERVGENTALSQIIRLVENASDSKAPVSRIADKVSAIFVPIVLAIAAVTFAVWLISGAGVEFALTCAVSVLVISCPCALGLAAPIAVTVGMGRAAEMGVLIKSAAAMETLEKADTVVLDKTGTVTCGKPAVKKITVFNGMTEAEFIANAAALESGSEHPLASAVTACASEKGLKLPKCADFRNHSGKGVSARINGRVWLAGKKAFAAENGLDEQSLSMMSSEIADAENAGAVPMIFICDGKPAGIIYAADTIRPDSTSAVEKFRRYGMKTIMLTGDGKAAAENIRREAGIDEVISDVLPDMKEECIRKLQSEGHTVIMTGDGINDAPALTRADVGMAVSSGTDIAMESADIILMNDSLESAAAAIELSRKVIANIRLNLFWAFFYNILGIPAAAGVFYPLFGIRLSPMIGAAAMSLSSVCVVTNAMRLRNAVRTSADRKDTEISETAAVNPAVSINVAKGNDVMNKTLKVDGMMCEHCREHVRKALAGIDGVSGVNVDLDSKTAEVEISGNVTDEMLIVAVTEAGYTAVTV